METERGPEETGAKSVIEAILALLVTETEQRINPVQRRGDLPNHSWISF